MSPAPGDERHVLLRHRRCRLVQPYSNAEPEPVRIGDNFKQPFVPGFAPINLGISRALNRNGFQGEAAA